MNTEPAAVTQTRSDCESMVKCSGARRFVMSRTSFIEDARKTKPFEPKDWSGDLVLFQLRLHLANYRLSQRGPGRDDHSKRIGIVFRLRDQVCRNQCWVPSLARYHNLSRPGEHIDCTIESDQPLCSCDVDISGPDDLVELGECFPSRTRKRRWPARPP